MNCLNIPFKQMRMVLIISVKFVLTHWTNTPLVRKKQKGEITVLLKIRKSLKRLWSKHSFEISIWSYELFRVNWHTQSKEIIALLLLEKVKRNIMAGWMLRILRIIKSSGKPLNRYFQINRNPEGQKH